MKPERANLLGIASHCATTVASLEGRDPAEAELLREAEAEFRNAVRGLPPEDIASIRNYIRFVRSERRRSVRAAR